MKLLDLSAGEARRLREFFREAKYTQASFQEILRSEVPGSVRLRNLPRLDYLTRAPERLPTLIRCFLAGLPVDTDRFENVVPRGVREACEKGGLIERADSRINPAVILQPIDDALIASDALGDDLPEDVVFPVNASSANLSQAVPRARFDSVLDLGTGTGVLALSVAPRAGKVVATDVNPRALVFAEFNMRLNGVTNVKFAQGERFEPLRDRTFDLALCNPPYLLTPTMRHRYSDNDMPLDQFCRTLVREASAHLVEGGLFQMLCQWVEIEGQPWQERLSAWADGTGCDLWVIRNYTAEPNEYVERMLLRGLGDKAKTPIDSYVEWMDTFRAAGVEHIYGGYVFLRKRSGRNWARLEEIDHTLKKPFGDDVLQGFRNKDFLDAHSGDELLSARLQLASNARLVQSYGASEGRWHPDEIKDLSRVGGLGCQSGVDAHIATLAARFDGVKTVAHILDGAAPAEKHVELLAVIRGLVEGGFLHPAP